MHAKSLRLLEQIKEVIEGYDFALTLRQIYYQLVAKQIIPNEQKYYGQLSRLCVIGRDERMLPEDMFADRLRQIDKPSAWKNLKDFMVTVKWAYSKDKWIDQDKYIEIWTEKDALRGVIDTVTHAFGVGLLVVRGQVSRTAIYESYKRISKQVMDGKECHLYYFGDFDPSGLSIYDSLVERLERFGPLGTDIHFERIALTADQIAEYNLPQDPAKQSDPNYRKFVAKYGDNVVELDSLPPDALRDLIKDCIRPNIDEDILLQTQEMEQEETKKLQEFVKGLSL